jgi:hypothetical protein
LKEEVQKNKNEFVHKIEKKNDEKKERNIKNADF